MIATLNSATKQIKPQTYNLHLQTHDFILPEKDNQNFIPHELYESIYR